METERGRERVSDGMPILGGGGNRLPTEAMGQTRNRTELGPPSHRSLPLPQASSRPNTSCCRSFHSFAPSRPPTFLCASLDALFSFPWLPDLATTS